MSYIIKPVRNTKVKLQKEKSDKTSIWTQERGLKAKETNISKLADILQNYLQRPVIDESGLAGYYNFDLTWETAEMRSISAALEKTLGLQLVEEKRTLEALIIDRADKSFGLSMMSSVSELSSRLPRNVRQRVSSLLSTH